MLTPQVSLLSDAFKLPQIAAGERVGEVAKLEPGQPVAARIQEQLPDGRYKVLLAGRALSMELPASARPGQDIRLVYVGPQPRLSFALAQTPGSSATVSGAGRLISALASPGHQPVAAAAPLFEAMPTESGEIAPRLREALMLSGLFYESHQAQWVEGDRPLNQLLREPQGRLSRAVAGDDPANARSPAEPGAAQPTSANDMTTQSTSDRPTAPEAPVHPDSVPIVQQQLSTLETGQIVWQGQIWPGQSMDWKIAGFARQRHADADAESDWQTQLSLELPALGSIDAHLRLQRGGVAIALHAGDTATAGLLQAHGDELAQAMRAAGLSVSDVRVSSDASA